MLRYNQYVIFKCLRGEMVDTHDLKSCAYKRTGSSPVEGNNFKYFFIISNHQVNRLLVLWDFNL